MLSLCVLGSVLLSCSLAKRRVVDGDGAPVEGALVISSRGGDMFFLFSGGPKASAFLTDPDGFAPVVSTQHVMAIKPGYHTWTDEGLADHGRTTATDDEDAIVLHRRSDTAQPDVHVSSHQVLFARPEDELQSVPLPPGIGVDVELIDRTRFRVRAREGQVTQSRRFYFAGPSSESWVTTLSQEDDLFFYAKAPSGRVHKVGVTRGGYNSSTTIKREIDGVSRQVPADRVSLLWAELGDRCNLIEPRPRPVRALPLNEHYELFAPPDSARVADALDAAVARGDVALEKVETWLSRLRSAPVERQGPDAR